MRIIIFLICLMIPIFSPALEPATITITNIRAEAVSPASSETYYRGEALRFTNCIIFSGSTTSSVRQNLTGLTLTLTWGDGVITSLVITGTVNNATSGIWSASANLRTNEGAKTYFQIKITDGTNSMVYPFKYIDTKTKL